MKIYWLFLAVSLLVCFIDLYNYDVIAVKNHYEKRAKWLQTVLFFGVLILFCGLRSGIADTGTYIAMFEDYPSSLGAIDWSTDIKDKGFYVFSVLYKQFISEDFHGWLFLIALISSVAMMIPLKKYSSFFGLSCFLFIATTLFTNLVNGIRQFICAAILFFCMDLIEEGKFWKYALIVLLLSTIHGSTILMLPIYFVARAKPWSGKMWLIMAIAIGAGIFFDKVFPVMGALLENTQYENYVDYIATSGVGSNVIRLFIAGIPCLLAYIGRPIIEEEGNKILDISINMSILNLCIFFVATFSSGMAFGRLTAFFDIYNLILLPWLLKYVFNNISSKIVTVLCIIAYMAFFYFQMEITWGMVYESDILNIFC